MMRQARIQRRWTQEYVGTQTGVTAEAIRLMEAGQRYPSYPVLVKLEDLFGMTHRELFAAAPDAEVNSRDHHTT